MLRGRTKLTFAVRGGTNAYLAQVNAGGTGIVAQLLLANVQAGSGIALDPSTGNVYLVGSAPDPQGNLHVFVQQADSSLNLLSSFTIMGSGAENGAGVAKDPSTGSVYVTGTTSSPDLSPMARHWQGPAMRFYRANSFEVFAQGMANPRKQKKRPGKPTPSQQGNEFLAMLGALLVAVLGKRSQADPREGHARPEPQFSGSRPSRSRFNVRE